MEALEQVLRAARPRGAEQKALDRRLAVASILAATGAEQRPRLGTLQVQSRIGGGAMGVVYRAYDPELQRLVAVKLLRSWTAQEAREHVLEEARRLARLSHPNVVAVHAIVDDADGAYFTMEYVAGDSLEGWLLARPVAPWRDVLELFVQAGRGLAAAHEAGIVHRDFKPQNVLVGEDGRVRVADFGLARVLSDDQADRAGSPYYMAPEVVRGEPATVLSDQYGFCKALSDALSSRQPPAHVLELVRRGLEPEPQQRHASMQALLEQLERALRGELEQHPRTLLLERVERLWLRGVLEGSLAPNGTIELPLALATERVEPPWRSWAQVSKSAPPPADEAGPARLRSSRQLSQLLSEGHGSLLLLGPPGAGKTTLLLQLCRELWRTASLNPQAPAPVVLSLSTYAPAGGGPGREEQSAHFYAWLQDELVVKYGLPRPAVRRWFGQAAVVLLLDGLDETEPSRRTQVVATLNAFRRSHPLTMVVTCRDSEYQALGAKLELGMAAELQPLDDRSMTRLLEERQAVHLSEQLARDPGLRERLRNPLLLTLYANEDPSETMREAPGWAQAYARYVQGALGEVGAVERERIERGLGWLARTMALHNTTDLWLEKLHFGWLGGRALAVAGYALAALVVGLFAVGLNLAQVPLTGYPLSSALVFGVGVWLSSFAYTRGRLLPVERLRWSGRRALRLLPITLVCASVIGLIEALKVNFVANLVGAAITGAILALLFALEPGEQATRVAPNAGIHQSLANALRVSFGAGLPVGLLFYSVVQPYVTHPLAERAEYTGEPRLIVGVAVGLFVFTAMFLIYGGFAVIMHYVLRAGLALCTPLPANLPRFLNRAADLGLLRRVGGGYVFLHRTLLDYFAERGAQRE